MQLFIVQVARDKIYLVSYKTIVGQLDIVNRVWKLSSEYCSKTTSRQINRLTPFKTERVIDLNL